MNHVGMVNRQYFRRQPVHAVPVEPSKLETDGMDDDAVSPAMKRAAQRASGRPRMDARTVDHQNLHGLPSPVAFRSGRLRFRRSRVRSLALSSVRGAQLMLELGV